MLALFAAAGVFVLLPFRRELRFGALASPFAGMLCVTLGTATLYAIATVSLWHAAVASWAVCVAAGTIGVAICRPSIRKKDIAWMLGATIAIGLVMTRTADATTLRMHAPALLYADSTDQMGYAQAADWLCHYSVRTSPRATPQGPCNAWLTVLFRIDPRFGSFFLLGIIATMKGVAGAFAYDVGCAIVLAAAVLGIAGVFTRSPQTLILLLAGLVVSHWFDSSRLGYFGKLIAYPGAIAVAGLFCRAPRPHTIESIAAMALLIAATAICHSGVATALFFAALIVPVLLFRLATALHGPAVHLASVWRDAIALSVLAGTAVIATGLPARPTSFGPPPWFVSWTYILPRTMDLENQGSSVSNVPFDGRPPLPMGEHNKLLSGLGWKTVLGLAELSLILTIAMAILAAIWSEPVAFGFLISPPLLLLIFWLANDPPAGFQLFGFIYPASLCALAVLLDRKHESVGMGKPQRVCRVALAVVAVVTVAVRAPRYFGAVQRYAGPHRAKSQQFVLPEIDRLANAIGSQPVEVDMRSYTHLLFVVVELGHRQLHLQWTPDAFNTAFSYMGWPMPTQPPCNRRLVLAFAPVPVGWHTLVLARPYRLIGR